MAFTFAASKRLTRDNGSSVLTDQQSNVTLIWAHTPQRWLAFRQLGMAGIDFGVERDLSGMPEGEVAATLQELGLSSTVIGEFNRLLHHTEIGSYVVSSIPGWTNRKWLIGEVVGGYQYRPNLRHDCHTVQVKWGNREYAEDEITELLGVDPSRRRLAVNRLDALYRPASDSE